MSSRVCNIITLYNRGQQHILQCKRLQNHEHFSLLFSLTSTFPILTLQPYMLFVAFQGYTVVTKSEKTHNFQTPLIISLKKYQNHLRGSVCMCMFIILKCYNSQIKVFLGPDSTQITVQILILFIYLFSFLFQYSFLQNKNFRLKVR